MPPRFGGVSGNVRTLAQLANGALPYRRGAVCSALTANGVHYPLYIIRLCRFCEQQYAMRMIGYENVIVEIDERESCWYLHPRAFDGPTHVRRNNGYIAYLAEQTLAVIHTHGDEISAGS